MKKCFDIVNTVLAYFKISHILDPRWLLSGLLDDQFKWLFVNDTKV